MPDYIGALDQGTTSTRFMIFDHGGNVIAKNQKEHRQYYPQPGWVEHDPLEIWQRAKEVIAETLSGGHYPLAAIGITNQRETIVVWDRRTGQPIHPAIVWQDTRTDEICKKLGATGGIDRFRAQTGLPLATYFSGPKIKWILDHVPGASEQAAAGELCSGTIDTWLIWNLTGQHITDVTNASRTQLMNINTLDWDEEILAALDIPRSMLPQIRSSSEVYGLIEIQKNQPIHGSPAPIHPQLEGMPISGDLGDQQAALFGQTCFQPGEAKNTYGTGCFLLMNTGVKPMPSNSGLLTTVAYKIGPENPVYALEGSIAIAGALVHWLRDNLGLIHQSSDIEALANSVDDNGGIYFVPAFSGLFAPYWRSDARGAILGLTRYVNKGHVARAALEATAYQTREVLEAMENDSKVKLNLLKVDGGMVVNSMLMQFQADILNVPVVRPKVAETTALGAAYAAGLAIGYWKNKDELSANWGKDKEWIPNMKFDEREKYYSFWKKAITRSFDWLD